MKRGLATHVHRFALWILPLACFGLAIDRLAGDWIASPRIRLTLHIVGWALLIAGIVLGAIAIREMKRVRRRLAAGRCPACGYDLRATSDRCPECGLLAK